MPVMETNQVSRWIDPVAARTTIAQKVVVAVSGLALAAWTLLHMVGTASVFAGPEVMNRSAEFLRATPLLWVLRVGLVALFVAHIVLAARLAERARRARPVSYATQAAQTSTWASRTMRITGPVLGLWIVYHVLHIYGPAHADYVPGDVFHNLVEGLRSPWVVATYVIATLLFAFHLAHGSMSALRSLGARPRLLRTARPIARLYVWGVTLGFLAPLVYALLGGWSPAG